MLENFLPIYNCTQDLFHFTLSPLYMDRVQLPQGCMPVRGNTLLFTSKSLGLPGTHLIELEGMKGESIMELQETSAFRLC